MLLHITSHVIKFILFKYVLKSLFGYFIQNKYICRNILIVMLELKDCLDKLKLFKQMFGSKYGIIRLGIFGSVVRNENTENSDIDIVVELNNPTLQLMYELKQALKDIFSCEVDLVRFRNSLRPLLKSNIEKEAIYV